MYRDGVLTLDKGKYRPAVQDAGAQRAVG